MKQITDDQQWIALWGIDTYEYCFFQAQLSLTYCKPRLLDTFIFSILAYKIETWTIKKETENRVNVLEVWFYRRMLKMSWTEDNKQTEGWITESFLS